MGTLGCINDMIQRDKENRELRKLGNARRKERLEKMYRNSKTSLPEHVTAEDVKQIQKQVEKKRERDLKREVSSAYFIVAVCVLLVVLMLFLLMK